jgi:hypothetical protein
MRQSARAFGGLAQISLLQFECGGAGHCRFSTYLGLLQWGFRLFSGNNSSEEVEGDWWGMEAGQAAMVVEEKHPKYRGVRKRPWGKSAAEIRVSSLPWPAEMEIPADLRIWLGTFDEAEQVRTYQPMSTLYYVLPHMTLSTNLPCGLCCRR